MAEPPPESGSDRSPGFHLRGRVVGLLAGALVVICVAVILTDRWSPRDRHPQASPAATAP
jgi:hypothetical protein